MKNNHYTAFSKAYGYGDWLTIKTINKYNQWSRAQEEPVITMKTIEKAWSLLKKHRKRWNVFYTPKKKKGEKNLKLIMKVILKGKLDGKGKQFNITTENEGRYKSFLDEVKVGASVMCFHRCKLTEYYIFKKIDYRKNTPKGKEGRAVFNISSYLPELWSGSIMKKMKELSDEMDNKKEQRKNRKRAYWKTTVDVIPGEEEIKENPEKMKFPCHITYSYYGKRKVGMLITGFPNSVVEYQLVKTQEQSDLDGVCTIRRSTDLKELMDMYDIEVVKGETKVWKVGKFSG